MEQQSSGFNVSQLFTNALGYIQHYRLMAGLACLGVLLGVLYFLFSTPVYSARSAVNYRVFTPPLKDGAVAETNVSPSRMIREVTQELTSHAAILSTAKRLGIVGKSAVYEDVIRTGLIVRCSVLNGTQLEMLVLSPNAEVVRTFCEAHIEEYDRNREETWKKFRDRAQERYAQEVKALEEQAEKSLREIASYERDGKMTEAAIEHARLQQLPNELLVANELRARMDRVKTNLDELRASSTEDNIDQVLAELSLLTLFKKQSEVKTGDLVRKSDLGALSTAKVNEDKVVVQPGMIEGLTPWEELEKERRILLDDLKKKSETYLSEHIEIRNLRNALRQNEVSLRSELMLMRQQFDFQYQQVAEKQKTLNERLPEYHRVNEELSFSARQYGHLEQDKQVWEAARKRLNETLNVISYSQDTNFVELTFAEHFSLRDIDPVSPNKMKLVMLTSMLSIGLALGGSTAVNLLSSGMKTLNEVEQVTGLKAIGIVPLVDPAELEVIARSPAIGSDVPNFLLECFRNVRSHILLDATTTNKSNLVVMVTSARPSEGKSTQSSNLAWAFQSLGKKTVIVDCDLRRGRVHEIFGLDNREGMTQLLQGSQTIEQSVKKTSLPLLDVLPRGPVIVGTTELIAQEVFEAIVDQLRQDYECIILDTPPILGLSETVSVQRVSDGVVMVSRAEVTPQRDVVDAVNTLRRVNTNFYGIVLNGLDLSKAGNYYNYYYYSSAYYDNYEANV